VRAVALLLVFLAGCAQTEKVAQPRALLYTGTMQPLCFFWCNLDISVVDSEGAQIQGGTGDISIAKPVTTSTSRVNVTSDNDTSSAPAAQPRAPQ
jgi:hypothetical protein